MIKESAQLQTLSVLVVTVRVTGLAQHSVQLKWLNVDCVIDMVILTNVVPKPKGNNDKANSNIIHVGKKRMLHLLVTSNIT